VRPSLRVLLFHTSFSPFPHHSLSFFVTRSLRGFVIFTAQETGGEARGGRGGEVGTANHQIHNRFTKGHATQP
jgi:hypothetical protein